MAAYIINWNWNGNGFVFKLPATKSIIKYHCVRQSRKKVHFGLHRCSKIWDIFDSWDLVIEKQIWYAKSQAIEAKKTSVIWKENYTCTYMHNNTFWCSREHIQKKAIIKDYRQILWTASSFAQYDIDKQQRNHISYPHEPRRKRCKFIKQKHITSWTVKDRYADYNGKISYNIFCAELWLL